MFSVTVWRSFFGIILLVTSLPRFLFRSFFLRPGVIGYCSVLPCPRLNVFPFPFVSPSLFLPSGGTVPFRPFPFPFISFFPGDYLSPAGEPRPTAQARRTIKKHGGGMADVAGICWRTPLSRRTAASRRTFFKIPATIGMLF